MLKAVHTRAGRIIPESVRIETCRIRQAASALPLVVLISITRTSLRQLQKKCHVVGRCEWRHLKIVKQRNLEQRHYMYCSCKTTLRSENGIKNRIFVHRKCSFQRARLIILLSYNQYTFPLPLWVLSSQMSRDSVLRMWLYSTLASQTSNSGSCGWEPRWRSWNRIAGVSLR